MLIRKSKASLEYCARECSLGENCLTLTKLDVGCGYSPQGDVNVDITIKTGVKNFIQADAQHLPFKTKVFSETCSSHVVEHVKNPLLMIYELKRVTKDVLTIVTPLSFSFEYRAFLGNRVHTYWFLPYWFRELGFKTRIRTRFLRPNLVTVTLPFPLPFFEIEALIVSPQG